MTAKCAVTPSRGGGAGGRRVNPGGIHPVRAETVPFFVHCHSAERIGRQKL